MLHVQEYLQHIQITKEYIFMNVPIEYVIFLRFYLFIHERHRERGRDTGRGRSRLHAGNPTRNLNPGLQDHTLG